MNTSIKQIFINEEVGISSAEKDLVRAARKKYLSGIDSGIPIEESYKNFLSKFSNLK